MMRPLILVAREGIEPPSALGGYEPNELIILESVRSISTPCLSLISIPSHETSLPVSCYILLYGPISMACTGWSIPSFLTRYGIAAFARDCWYTQYRSCYEKVSIKYKP